MCTKGIQVDISSVDCFKAVLAYFFGHLGPKLTYYRKKVVQVNVLANSSFTVPADTDQHPVVYSEFRQVFACL